MADTGLTVWAAGFWPDDFWAAGFWSGDDTPLPTPTVYQTPAGSSRKNKGPRRYFVEIDGQTFMADTRQQAQAILERARKLAEDDAEKQADQKVSKRKAKGVIPEVLADVPEVSVSPELAQDFAPIIAEIRKLYEQAAQTAEIRARMEQIARNEEEDELILLL